MLILADNAASNKFYGYSRIQNDAGDGFSVEAFPVENFSSQTSHSAGLKRVAAALTYQTNCFVGSLSEAVDYELKLFNGSTGVNGDLSPREFGDSRGATSESRVA